MSGHNWEPGDVAETTYNRTISRAFVVESGHLCPPGHDHGMHWHGRSGGWNPIDDHAVTFRPLVVIDPEDREQVERLLVAYWTERRADDPEQVRMYPQYVNDLQAALREFAAPTPPKPDEPQGLGAVVEDASGLLWTRVESGEAVTRNPWYPANDADKQPDEYNHIKAVRVLSEGVAQ